MDRKTDILDSVKTYAGLFGIACIIVGLFLILGIKEKGINCPLMLEQITTGILVAGGLLIILYFALRLILKNRLGKAYTGFCDVAGEFHRQTMGSADVSNQRMQTVKSDRQITEGILWKQMSNGYNTSYLLRLIVLIALEILFFYGLVLMVADKKVLGIVLGVLFVLIIGYFMIAAAKGVKRKPDGIVAYMDNNQISYQELENDFKMAEKCGTDVWLGSEYVYLYAAGVRIVKITDIMDCSIQRMSGWTLRRPLPYYVLMLQTTDGVILKYGNSRLEFQKFEHIILERINE